MKTTNHVESIDIDILTAVTGGQAQTPSQHTIGFDRQGTPLQTIPPVGTDMFDAQGHLVGCDAFPQGDPRSCG